MIENIEKFRHDKSYIKIAEKTIFNDFMEKNLESQKLLKLDNYLSKIKSVFNL